MMVCFVAVTGLKTFVWRMTGTGRFRPVKATAVPCQRTLKGERLVIAVKQTARL
jgi:hypothetical protein